MARFNRSRFRVAVLISLGLAGLLWTCSDHSPKLPPLLKPIAQHEAQDSCNELVLDSRSGRGGALMTPGRFCLNQDFRQRRYVGAGHEWPTYGHAVLEIFGGDIDIDLRGHTLLADSRSHAIQAAAERNNGRASSEGRQFGLTTRQVRIHDGYIDLRPEVGGSGVRLIDRWRLHAADEVAPDRGVSYLKTQYVLENLVIRTKGEGVLLEGDGNIIRNCIIESEGNAAIILAGPNGTIQDNKIILRDRWIPSEVDVDFSDIGFVNRILPSRARPRAAIVLRDASGTKIIGNSIEIEGASDTRHAIHVRDASKDILVKGNRFIGTDSAAFVESSSTVVQSDNEFRRR